MQDPGALIQTGSSQSAQLVRLSENQVLRLDFPVSVSYVGDVAIGDKVEIHLEGAGAVLEATISRFPAAGSTWPRGRWKPRWRFRIRI